MILIAESGSSKTQWCIVDSDRVQDLVQTPGINPFNLKGNEIEGIISQAAIGVDIYKIDKIYFYGAGCSSSKNKEKVHSALFNIFKCDQIEVDSDLKAACLALAGDKAGIICLMGTGSNSCFWDGRKISSNIPSLGYILGDEGGGVSIGKQLIADYLKLQMPPHLRTKFSSKYDISTEFVLERVYQMQMPNRYLAGFTPFAEENIDEEYCKLIVYNQFKLFIERNILHYSNPENLPLYFCGSIAFSFKETLNEICNNYNLRIDKIVKEPINDLAFYFKYKMKY